MLPGEASQLGKRLIELMRGSPRENILRLSAKTRKQLDRHIKLMPGGVGGKGPQYGCYGRGNSCRIGGLLHGYGIGATEDLRRNCKECRTCVARISFKIGKPRHRFVVKVEAVRIE